MCFGELLLLVGFPGSHKRLVKTNTEVYLSFHSPLFSDTTSENSWETEMVASCPALESIQLTKIEEEHEEVSLVWELGPWKLPMNARCSY